MFTVAPKIVKTSTTRFVGLVPHSVDKKPQLRPSYCPLGLHWWQTGVHGDSDGPGGYSTNSHSSLLGDMTTRAFIPSVRVRAWMMDTTNGNPAVLREELWCHAMYLECLQHIGNNTLRDLMKIPIFKAAHDAAQELSTWIRRSAKRIEVWRWQSLYVGSLTVNPHLLCLQAYKKFCKTLPLGSSNTRFGQHLLVMQRIVKEWPGLSTMYATVAAGTGVFNGGAAPDAVKTVDEFKSLYGRVLPKYVGALVFGLMVYYSSALPSPV